MKAKLLQSVRTLFVTLIMGIAMVAVVQFDNPVETVIPLKRKAQVKPDWRRMYPSDGIVDGKSNNHVEKELKARMADDDLLGKNPFSHLSVPEALEKAIAHATAFERQTLRSRSYRDEAGYDLLHYEVLRRDGSLAQILAYVSEAAPGDPEKVIVMILSPSKDMSEYSLFQDGTLSELKNVASETGVGLFTDRLASGVPFLSVSR